MGVKIKVGYAPPSMREVFGEGRGSPHPLIFSSLISRTEAAQRMYREEKEMRGEVPPSSRQVS